jgi:pimeloyl-ACP methyl ester carboxylesterase
MFSRLVRPVDLAVLDDAEVRLITFDRPGYGGTDPLPGATVTERAGDAIAVLDAEGVARARVIGWSNGVPHALALAAIAPDRVESVDAVATPVVDGFQSGNPLIAPILDDPAGFAEFVEAAVAAGDPVEAVDRYAATSSYLVAREDESLRVLLVDALREGIRQAAAGAIADMSAIAQPWGFSVPDLKVPLRVWHGEDDVVSSRVDAERLVGLVPNASLHVVPGGHDVLFSLWEQLFRR